MHKLLTLLLAAALLCAPGFARKRKPPATPTQPALVYGCITVEAIYFRGVSFANAFSGHPPGVEGRVVSSCALPVTVFVTVAYFDADGSQIGYNLLATPLAAGANWNFYDHADDLTTQDGYRVGFKARAGGVIAVKAF